MNLRLSLVVKRALIKGFLVGDYQERRAEFIDDMAQWLQAGKLKYKEDVVKGLQNAPHAFIGLLQGENFGKLVIQVGDHSTKD